MRTGESPTTTRMSDPMIENPQLGQKVWHVPASYCEEFVIHTGYTDRVWNDELGFADVEDIYDSPAAAAAAMRAEAKRLLDAAAELMREADE
jgi:hypothetical protein